jgi:hypothetical protein
MTRNPMICSSLNRFFMSILLVRWDWTPDQPATQNPGGRRIATVWTAGCDRVGAWTALMQITRRMNAEDTAIGCVGALKRYFPLRGKYPTDGMTINGIRG